MRKTKFSKTLKIFRSDSCREYLSYKFHDSLKSQGTISQLSCTETPQQNGVSERKHRHIVETARTLLLFSSAPKEFWGEAVHTSVYLINRLPSPIIGKISPYECLYGTPPTYSHLKVFCSTCFVLLSKREQDKLSQRSFICVFIGYGTQQKGSRCYDPHAKKLRISRHVTFWEQVPFFSLPPHKPPATETEILIPSIPTLIHPIQLKESTIPTNSRI